MKYFIKTILFIFIISVISCSSQNNKITLFLAGDSTIAEKNEKKRPETGWGEKIGFYFKENVLISNHARNGRSTRTFLSEGRWQAIMDSVKPGDYVFIQFGHNDQSRHKVDRYTPPKEYKNNLRRFIDETRAKKANPVIVTPVMRRRFTEEGKFYDVHGVYPDLAEQVAKEKNAPMLNLTSASQKLYEKLGPEGTIPLFLHLTPGESANYPDGKVDNTHFNDHGAKVIAGLVADLIKKSNLELKKYLKE